MNQICVLGSGSWATAIVKVLLEQKETHVNWWVREADIRDGLSTYGYNVRYLSTAELDMSRVAVYANINQAVEASDTVMMVIPSAFAKNSLADLRPRLFQNRDWVNATKGLIAPDGLTMTQFLKEYHRVPEERLAVVSGPTHAEEVARKRLSYLTVVSGNAELREKVRSLIHCRYVDVVDSTDMNGIEYATALKNIYALGIGIAFGMGMGDNLQAVLATSALREMQLFLDTFAPMPNRPITDNVYLGDLLVTCYSQHSRNRMFGSMIGQGYSVHSAQLEMNMVAEGYYAVESIQKLCDSRELYLPIVRAVYEVLYLNLPPHVLIRKAGELL